MPAPTRTIAAAVLLSLGTRAGAQLNEWDTGGAGGVWTDPAAWSLGHVPIAGETPRIWDGSTVDMGSAVTPLLSGVYLGLVSGTGGSIKMDSGEIHTSHFHVGNGGSGTLLMKGTAEVHCSTNLAIGVNASSADGYLKLEDGVVMVSSLLVGSGGDGAVEMYAGSIDATSSISLTGTGPSPATFGMFGGSVNSPTLQVGSSGEGDFTLVSGNVAATNLLIGNNSSAIGLLRIGGGTLDAGHLRSGINGSGTTRQTGGVVTATQITVGQGTGDGVYKLEGGTLDVQRLYRGYSGATYAFTMTGGELRWTEFGSWPAPFDMVIDDGLVKPYGDLPGSAFVRGNFHLGSNATIEMQLVSDKVVIHTGGSVILEGELVLVPPGALYPPPGYVITLIDNDDADPVIGQFVGLPEGATVTVPVGASNFNFKLSYTGGDGNDVTLAYQDCPPDINSDGVLDNADLSDFVTLFLAGDLAADFTDDGFIDNGDISAFIAAFLAGCP
ncbi:MAG: GC-type dockerin domain-anchored protein [Phycisphaerales bacterium JB040]